MHARNERLGSKGGIPSLCCVALFRLDEYNQAAREAIYQWIDQRTLEHAPSLQLLETATCTGPTAEP